MTRLYSGNHLVRRTLLVYVILMVAWTLAWLLKITLIDTKLPWLATNLGSFLWWTLVKTIVWVVPGAWLIRLSGRTLQEVIGLANWRSALAWGGGIGLIAALPRLVQAAWGFSPLVPPAFSPTLLNTVIVTPVYEEFLARGALMGNLQQRWLFWFANVGAALMFVGMHLPGWYFMGTLSANLTRPIGGALSIFVLGLLFGYAAQRSHSLLGGVIAHGLNNLAASN